MWRAVFLAVGITMILAGLQLFFVEQVEIKRIRGARKAVASAFNPAANQQVNPFQNASFEPPRPAIGNTQPTILYTPKDWMPWSFVAIGTIILIYTSTIPNRSRHSE